ncbi:glycerol ethanol, ferric requiring protein [Coemansia javaensis]|uniref:Chloride channel protein n=1 Tax=Coemansia javaensis TaxID=2761396 RepID=A0A9W8LJD7_9FUNG|nr:glycerol ethanol, ferric requiring protein [Coemansia javaensis]
MSTARFDEFHTVDWVDDGARERRWRRAQEGAWSAWRRAGDAAVSWLVVLLVGALIGANTALISIATEWLSDAKLGLCRGAWWLNAKFCCWEHAEPLPPAGAMAGALAAAAGAESCPDWVPWDRLLLGADAAVVRWAAFVATGTAMATACALLVREYAPLAAGSGLPEIKAILGGFVIRGFMGAWTLLMKSVGLAMAVGSGLSVGKEGPAVHMGCCIGNVVSRNVAKYRRSAARQREIVSAAAAAGVAVAFGAPIGGVLFSLEDLCSRFPRRTMWRSFFCALIATVSLQAMNPFWTGKLVMFQASYDRDWHAFELVFFALVGVFGGVYGGLCIRANTRVAAFRKRHLAPHAVLEAAALALGTTAVTYANPYTREDMGEMLGYLLQECTDRGWLDMCLPENAWRVVWGLLAATALRIAGTVLAYGCRVPCGIFVPSMAIGASFGRMLGTLLQAVHRAHPKWPLFAQCAPDTVCITPATYAFLGAAAAMSGVTKVTVSVVVIMYELTGALNFIVPTMIVVMIARVIGDMIVEGGISEQMILLNGLPFMDELDDDDDGAMLWGEGRSLLGLPVAALMRPCDDDICVLPAAGGLSVARLARLVHRGPPVRGYPVVDNEQDMRLVGYVHRDAVLRALAAHRLYSLDDADADGGGDSARRTAVFGPHQGQLPGSVDLSELVNATPITVRPHTSAETTIEIFRKLGPRTILVTSEDDGQLVGLLTRKDVLPLPAPAGSVELRASYNPRVIRATINELESIAQQQRQLVNRLRSARNSLGGMSGSAITNARQAISSVSNAQSSVAGSTSNIANALRNLLRSL